MAAYFFDASGIVKRYVRETGTAWVQAVADPATGNAVYLARISAVEVTSAIVRRQRGGSIAAPDAAAALTQFRQDVALEYRLIEITPPLLVAATLLAESHALRAYDAVQLAAVAELHAQRTAAGLPVVTLVSGDQELNTAAAALGLLVEDPNLHP
jgi:predicted nucleic acid-binding protein